MARPLSCMLDFSGWGILGYSRDGKSVEGDMQSPDLLQRFIFIIPLVLLPALLILVRFPWRMALFVWITGTLIQVAALFIASLPSKELPRVIVTFYPFAL